MPNVSFVRPELSKLLPMYYLIRDAIAGEPTVKEARTKYLPMPNASDQSKENKARYDAYIARAVFYNVARRTLFGLIGQVFMRDPVVKVPALLNPLVANATGSGINLTQLSKKAVSLNLAYSRAGILVDYPTTEGQGGASVAELEAGKIRPTLYVYAPTEIINWRTIDRGAEEVLSLVVIFETWCVQDDGFEMKNSGQFRVLRLDDEGYYVHEIWREPNPTKADGTKIPRGNYQLHEVFKPTDANGNRLDEIPFMFMGSENNDVNPDNPNFYDLASLNLAHYRNSADYEESCYVVGQPTPVLTGLTEEWVNNVLKGTVNFGSRGGIPLPTGADAKLLQAEPNTMLKEAMDTKERQMVALGAKLVEQKEVQRTATEAELEAASEGSTLSSATKNVSAAFEWALKWAARWIGAGDAGVKFELNTDFDIARMTPDERRQIIEEWQKGAITFTEMRTGLRKAGIATEDDAKAKADIAKDTAEAMALAMPDNVPGDGNTPPAGNVGNGGA
ncbi:62kDa structural protein [Pseudomonas phage HMGUpa1]|uniref:Portal protein n=2 Tax=Septimatrevirus TaxID=1921544 RepID=A0A5B9N5S4_9CAUD|nr:portal protein [Xanthomonas phage Samson]QEG09324.1 portal protein [Xanthomonas phage Samson]WID30686.1 62kDa structural protein [Pseudomonas phage HMGUpa1]